VAVRNRRFMASSDIKTSQQGLLRVDVKIETDQCAKKIYKQENHWDLVQSKFCR